MASTTLSRLETLPQEFIDEILSYIEANTGWLVSLSPNCRSRFSTRRLRDVSLRNFRLVSKAWEEKIRPCWFRNVAKSEKPYTMYFDVKKGSDMDLFVDKSPIITENLVKMTFSVRLEGKYPVPSLEGLAISFVEGFKNLKVLKIRCRNMEGMAFSKRILEAVYCALTPVRQMRDKSYLPKCWWIPSRIGWPGLKSLEELDVQLKGDLFIDSRLVRPNIQYVKRTAADFSQRTRIRARGHDNIRVTLEVILEVLRRI